VDIVKEHAPQELGLTTVDVIELVPLNLLLMMPVFNHAQLEPLFRMVSANILLKPAPLEAILMLHLLLARAAIILALLAH
jgi:hypothetical protein